MTEFSILKMLNSLVPFRGKFYHIFLLFHKGALTFKYFKEKLGNLLKTF